MKYSLAILRFMFRDEMKKIIKIILIMMSNFYKMILKLAFFVLLVFNFAAIHAQNIIAKVHDAATHIEIPLYDLPEFGGEILIEVPYAKYQISNPTHLELLQHIKIKKIQLVYSWHAQATAYHKKTQRGLNIRRMKRLYERYPDLFEDENIEWEMVGQTLFSTGVKAKKLFHGFIIHYKDEQSKHSSINLQNPQKNLGEGQKLEKMNAKDYFDKVIFVSSRGTMTFKKKA